MRVGSRGYDVMVDCVNHGLCFVTPAGRPPLSPPLIGERTQIDEMLSILGDLH